MCVVVRRDRMSRRKIPPAPRTRSKAAGAKAGCAFFWLLFFAQAKKSDSPKAKAFLPLLPKAPKATSLDSRLRGNDDREMAQVGKRTEKSLDDQPSGC
jgi:hypothetical protein